MHSGSASDWKGLTHDSKVHKVNYHSTAKAEALLKQAVIHHQIILPGFQTDHTVEFEGLCASHIIPNFLTLALLTSQVPLS